MMSIGKKNRIEFMNKGGEFMNTHPTPTIKKYVLNEQMAKMAWN